MVKSDTLILPLEDNVTPDQPEVVFIVKDIQNDEPYIGSISITRQTIMEGELNKSYSMWFTLFDSQSDDEYDGAMGLTDDEDPRILMELTLEQKMAPPPIMASPEREVRKSTTAPTTNNLRSSYSGQTPQ